MEEYKIPCKIGSATVRVHGTADPDRLRAATEKFLKKAQAQKKRAASANKELSHAGA